MAVVNVMEQYVDKKLGELLLEYDCCKCQHCVEDMKALALNKLGSRYVSTTNGELYSRVAQELIQQSNVDLQISIVQAIESVSKNPHHENRQ